MATPDIPYTLPHRPKSDPRLVIVAIVGVVAALVGLPGETAAELTDQVSAAVNALVVAGAAIAALAATVRAIWHRRLQAEAGAPSPELEDPTEPLDPPRAAR